MKTNDNVFKYFLKRIILFESEKTVNSFNIMKVDIFAKCYYFERCACLNFIQHQKLLIVKIYHEIRFIYV